MSGGGDTNSIPAHLIVDNATLALSGSTITLEFPTREDAEAVMRAISPDAFAYHDDVTPEGVAEAQARVDALRPCGRNRKVVEGLDPVSQALASLKAGLCGCHACVTERSEWQVHMHLCSECGNKRCPKASNHLLSCSGSNEPGQEGSVY